MLIDGSAAHAQLFAQLLARMKLAISKNTDES